VRRSRAHRTKGNPKDEILAEVIKYVEFTRERDIEVHWLFRHWLPGKHFKHEIRNSTGVLDQDHLKVELVGPTGSRKMDAHFVKVGDHRWLIEGSVPEDYQGMPLTIEMRYTWRGGGVLTRADLRPIQSSSAPGPYREHGFEFATVWSPAPVASAELILVFPPEYAPDRVAVKVKDEAGNQCEPEAAELSHHFQPLAVGVYAFRVPFPRIGHDYSLVWKPWTPEAGGEHTETDADYPAFSAVARTKGDLLARTFASVFIGGPWWGHLTVSLYLIDRSSPPLAVRVGFAAPGSTSATAYAKPLDRVPLVGDRSALAQAWWGIPTQVANRPASAEERHKLGFMDGETALLCLPLRFAFEWDNPPPWGIVRIGILEGGGLALFADDENLWTLLSIATMKTLAYALSQRTKVDATPEK
jgi:hypothetical protein